MKKMIAPIIITVIIIVYLLIYFGFVIWLIPDARIKIILGIIPIAFCGTMIYVCAQRIKEIRSGEEDDLSKY